MPEALICLSDGRVLASDVRHARGASERVRGLLGTHEMPPDRCLILPGAKQVHTFGMEFDIDVIFTDRHGLVLHVVHGMRPNRLSRIVWRSRAVAELRSGGAAGLVSGDRVAVRRVS